MALNPNPAEQPKPADPKAGKAEKVTPEPLKSDGVDRTVPAPGGDPDSVIREAKHALASPHNNRNDQAEADIERASKARALIAERNNADPQRVKAIDGELKALGFEQPLPTTVAQRGGDGGPVGRQAPGQSATT